MKIEEIKKFDYENAIWTITKDNIDDGDSLRVKSYNYPDGLKPKDLPYKFRLLDDDEIIYYYGKSSCNSSFAPLDDFGLGNAGCVDIQYYENGEYLSL